MDQQGSESAREWAVRMYGSVRLADERRTQRAMQVGEALASDPMGSLPKQLGGQAALKGAYRLMESPHVTYEQLMQPHLAQTRAQFEQHQQILLLQDTTEVSYHRHPQTTGLGPLGSGNHHGYLLQTVLAVDPRTRQVLGIAAQEAFLRQPAPPGESSAQRDKRKQKESEVWQRQVQRLGPAPQSVEVIHVGDRGSDIFTFLRECQRQGGGFVVRVQHDRRIDLRVELDQTPLAPGTRRYGKQRGAYHEPVRHLFEEVRGWESRGTQSLVLDGNQKRGQREAHLCISWGRVRLWPPDGEAGRGEVPLVVSVVRAWEPDPPAGVEAVEWMLLTSVEVEEEAQAWKRVEWYRCRWMVEDYHQCLKSGCRVEERHLQTFEGLRTLLGFLAPLAVRLLHLRASARQEPERLAHEVLPREVVQVVAHLAQVPFEQLTVRHCWRRIAQVGGYLGRKGDGDPGWQTLWKGWLHLQTLLEGIHLASQLQLE